MGDYTPVNSDQASFTMTASATIVGGQLLDCSGTGTVAPSGGVLHPIGIAAHDAPSGGRVTVYILSGEIHETVIKNTSVLTTGDNVIAAANGQVDKNVTSLAAAAGSGLMVGVCLIGGTGNAGGTVKARWIGIA